METGYTIGCFLTSHGFGHAARSCAIFNAVAKLRPGLSVRIFTEVPEWFFQESLEVPFEVSACNTDVGLVQSSLFSHDVQATLAGLQSWLPFDDARLDVLAGEVDGCELVYCDISALGIAVACMAGLPSVLFENFLWDWVYDAFQNEEPRFEASIEALSAQYALADLRIQSEPICHRREGLPLVPPVSREPRMGRSQVRDLLDIGADHSMVLFSRGGDPDALPFLHALKQFANTCFVFAGGVRTERREDNLRFLPFESEFFHPDLVHAADLVVGKGGYSMIAEVWAAGVPFAYVLRDGFRESPALDAFLQANIPSRNYTDSELACGAWVDDLPDLLKLPRNQPRPNGAIHTAKLLLKYHAGESVSSPRIV